MINSPLYPTLTYSYTVPVIKIHLTMNNMRFKFVQYFRSTVSSSEFTQLLCLLKTN